MALSYPGSELRIEQLAHALVIALGSSSQLRRKLLELKTRKILSTEQDLPGTLRATNAIWNTTIPVNELPPEILLMVAKYYTRDPTLWACFPLQPNRDLNRALTYLERSKSALINVTISIRSLQDLEVVKHFAPHIARTRSLTIYGNRDAQTAFLAFCNPAPSLQHLTIHAYEGSLRLPSDFLGRQAPLLRTFSFTRVCPTFEPPFPPQNLMDFYLHLYPGAGTFHISALFRFFSNTLLQKTHIDVPDETLEGVAQGQVILLESLVEFHGSQADRILPFLRLPSLKKLWVSASLGPGQVQKLTNTLPYDGRALLARATKMVYNCNKFAIRVNLSGKGVNVSLNAFRNAERAHLATVDWFSDETSIPFGQIEDLTVDGDSVATDFPIDVFALENMKILRTIPRYAPFLEGFFGLLHPYPGTGIPCRSLREIEYIGQKSTEPVIRPLITLVRKRNRARHPLGLVSLGTVHLSDQNLVKELREYVGEVRVRAWNVRT